MSLFTPHPPKQKEPVDLERLLQALQTMDANGADRMRDLRTLLLFLPLIWGVIWGVVFFIYLVVSGK